MVSVALATLLSSLVFALPAAPVRVLPASSTPQAPTPAPMAPPARTATPMQARTTMADARLYGRVTTTEGRTVEGWLRWGDAGSPDDVLDAAREIPRQVLREAERLDPEYGAEMRRKRSLVAFGVRITWAEDDLAAPPRTPTAIRMAWIAEIRPLEERRALLILTDGEEVELVASGDLGPGMGDLVLEPATGDAVTLDWNELERVELVAPPRDAGPPSEGRLYGTVFTRPGFQATGLVSWDRDEAFPADVLDGRDESGADTDIPFADVRAIEPVDDRSARIVLRSGVERILRGTNDVDRRNRGVEVMDPSLGRVLVAWEDLERVRFHEPAQDQVRLPVAPDDATGEAPGALRGTVYARDGRVLAGALRWGHDEEHVWELLDGRLDGALVGIELASIREVRPDGPDGALVQLRDGRTVRLHGTDDVGEGHRGIFVTPDGRARRLVRWADVDRVVLGS